MAQFDNYPSKYELRDIDKMSIEDLRYYFIMALGWLTMIPPMNVEHPDKVLSFIMDKAHDAYGDEHEFTLNVQ